MHRRFLDVTSRTTFDHLPARAEGDGWARESIAVLDVESPRGEDHVELGFELDGSTEVLPHHVDRIPLAPDQARTLAADLEAAAAAAERGEAMVSRRG
ncbi:DUF6360 family protein [Halococcus salsus]|uniref:DUF6360 family protein n=1 Tax=Halococcus salsus TaxID=2162894 RepID=UPI00135C239C|nr:DUF6360 family protein [Halococcus salsus]